MAADPQQKQQEIPDGLSSDELKTAKGLVVVMRHRLVMHQPNEYIKNV